MTMAAPGRVRRSIRFAQLDAQAQAAVREAPLKRERMTVSDRLEVPSFQNTQDWTGGMGISPSGRFQVVEEGQPRMPLIGREGIRKDLAGAILWVMAALLCVLLLVQFASIGAGNLRIQRLETRVENAQARSDLLRTQLEISGGDISVCTKAVELNLISSNGAPTIQLTAPSGATMTLVERATPTATSEPELRASAGNSN